MPKYPHLGGERLKTQDDGTLDVNVTGGNVTLQATDIEIGAVEIKDGATDTRAQVKAANAAAAATDEVLKVQPIAADGSKTVPVTDNGGSLTVDSAQLPAALSGSGNLKAAVAEALPAGTNNIGDVDVASLPTGQGKTLKFAVVDAALSGDNTIVAAVASNKIKVVSYVLVASSAVSVRLKSGAATNLSGAMSLAASGGVSAVGQPSSHLLETAVNTALVLNLSAAVQVSGHISYFEEA